MDHGLRVVTEAARGCELVRVDGDIDASTVGVLQGHLEQPFTQARTPKSLIVDLTKVGFLDSAGAFGAGEAGSAMRRAGRGPADGRQPQPTSGGRSSPATPGQRQ